MGAPVLRAAIQLLQFDVRFELGQNDDTPTAPALAERAKYASKRITRISTDPVLSGDVHLS